MAPNWFGEQPVLPFHHDASIYMIEIELNEAAADYEGGEYRFLRHNCSVASLQRGWTLMHPGKLTHYQQKINATKGMRLIQVSLVDS